eukprot:1590395-Amphidinium_carterae.1
MACRVANLTTRLEEVSHGALQSPRHSAVLTTSVLRTMVGETQKKRSQTKYFEQQTVRGIELEAAALRERKSQLNRRPLRLGSQVEALNIF